MALDDDRRILEAVERERSRLRGFIRKRIGSASEAEDILQDAVYELVEAFRLARPVEHIGPWLFRVVRNRITDLKRQGRREVPADELEDLLVSADLGPEEAAVRRALVEELAEALAALPAEQRRVFVAHEIEGRSFRELAEETGVGVNTLLSRKHYAVRRLRERLRDLYDGLRKGRNR